ncbi:MAG TPA: hypothetical protein DEQ74_02350 [Wolbachia sp.]|jgi:Sec-independent protein translocase protein TatA|uniref:Sec-independent protein translocase subunit TatB n=1 Tax=Wolbachia endosymbiont of Pentalonia nigronervosa TaxID=1301914 RepID=UPI000ED0ABDE|nr:twin-arginine translocase TatA/TatE family subunit [Wolbachia endosymbiont of Pentalonia nigronervosa]MBD0390945.1 hypothetical protein [Wolbachia endosymbiont of Pentalonia nigronervosa]HCE59649.1 hypothetical protein [Wolbachia sp.]
MFSIGLSEILVIALVSIIVLDKEKIPVFVDFVRIAYRCIMNIKSKTKKLLKDAGIEDLYNTEEITYVIGKDGKRYPSYNVSGQNNDSKNSGS